MSVAVGIQAGESAPRAWLVIDVGAGVGRAVSEQVLAYGERVVGTIHDPDSVADISERHPAMFTAEVLDGTDAAQLGHVVERSIATLGRIDVVLSNVGGSIELIRAVLPHLRRQGGARVILISSAGSDALDEPEAQEVAAFGVAMTVVESSADPFLVAEAIVDSADREPAPLRLTID